MKIVIIEDGINIALNMKKYIEEYDSSNQVVQILGSVEEAIDYFKYSPCPDLIFSDIELNDGICFDIFSEVEMKCPIIFTTSYSEYWQKAFKLNSIDYLLKPIIRKKIANSFELLKEVKEFYKDEQDTDRINNILQAISKDTQPVYKERFFLRKGDRYHLIKAQDVVYIYSSEKLTNIVVRGGEKYFSYVSLSKIEHEVDPAKFFRINRKYIVNIDHIQKVIPFFKGKLTIIMSENEKELLVSQAKANYFRNWLNF